MSDARAAAAVKPATDAEVDGLIRTCRLNAAPDTIWGRVLQEGALKLAARISADAARIRELEAAGRTMINAMNHTHERGETFPARVALAAAHLERMLAAAPRP